MQNNRDFTLSQSKPSDCIEDLLVFKILNQPVGDVDVGGAGFGCGVFFDEVADLYNRKRSSFLNSFRAPPGARTLDPNIKSVVLYQLS